MSLTLCWLDEELEELWLYLVKSNNGRVLCLGERVIGRELALKLASEFLDQVFDPESA